MKRKRKNFGPSLLLDESPKRTKVHAQRKFAQGSNVNSPVITPIRELESESPRSDVLPEPVELLPIKRPNTEDFLTFLCFRGTPILPPSLNFFNTASIVDTNGQVHEIKSEPSQKNGPIDITKCGTSDKPFIAFGVRKRADPIVISRQMDKKRRHALAIQALRRKYQEQKMAKIRALTISKLSEKVTNRTLVKTNTVSKTETVTKKTNSMHKTKVVATKHVKVTTQTLKTTMRPKMNQKMCLRSFRGRIVQKELPFIKRGVKNIVRNTVVEKSGLKNNKVIFKNNNESGQKQPSIQLKKNSGTSSRVTRSGLIDNKADVRRKQIRKRILRLTTVKKTVVSQRKSRSVNAKKRLRRVQKHTVLENISTKAEKKDVAKTMEDKMNAKKLFIDAGKYMKQAEKKDLSQGNKKFKSSNSKRATESTIDIKKDFKKVADYKRESKELLDNDKKQVNKRVDIKKEISKTVDIKKDPKKSVETKKSLRISNIVQKKETRNFKKGDPSSSEDHPMKKRSFENKDENVDITKKIAEHDSDDRKQKKSTVSKKTRSQSEEDLNRKVDVDGKILRKEKPNILKETDDHSSGIKKVAKEAVFVKKLNRNENTGEVNTVVKEKSKLAPKKRKGSKEIAEEILISESVDDLDNSSKLQKKSVIGKKTGNGKSDIVKIYKDNNMVLKKINMQKTGEKVHNSVDDLQSEFILKNKSASDKINRNEKTAIELNTVDENKTVLKQIESLTDIAKEIQKSDDDLENRSKLEEKSVLEKKSDKALDIDSKILDKDKSKPISKRKPILKGIIEDNADIQSKVENKSTSEKKTVDTKFDVKLKEVEENKIILVTDETKRNKEIVESTVNSDDSEGSKNKHKIMKTKTTTEKAKTIDSKVDLANILKISKKSQEMATEYADMDKKKSSDIIQEDKEANLEIVRELKNIDAHSEIFPNIEASTSQDTNRKENIKIKDTELIIAARGDSKKKSEIGENKKEEVVKKFPKEGKQESTESQKVNKKVGAKEKNLSEFKTLAKVTSKKRVRTKSYRKQSTEEMEELNNITDKMRKLDTKTTEPSTEDDIIIEKASSEKNLKLDKQIKNSGDKNNQNELIEKLESSEDINTLNENFEKADIVEIQCIEEKTIETDEKIQVFGENKMESNQELVKIDESEIKNITNKHTNDSIEVETVNINKKADEEMILVQKLTKNMETTIVQNTEKQNVQKSKESRAVRKENMENIIGEGKLLKHEDINKTDVFNTKKQNSRQQTTLKQTTEAETKNIENKYEKEIELGHQKHEKLSKIDVQNMKMQKVKNTMLNEICQDSNVKKDDQDSKNNTGILKHEDSEELQKDTNVFKKSLILLKPKKEVPKKDEITPKKDKESEKKIPLCDKEHAMPKMTQRPSRKTKEAAAIYMEILSHKLVQESRIDDDNISIDSFPELPNVKKTEQRENELKKAQTKTTKDEKPKDKTEDTMTDDKECSYEMINVEDIPDDIKLNDLKHRLQSSVIPLKKPVASKSKIQDQQFSDSDEIDIKTLISRMSEEKIEETDKESRQKEEIGLPKRQSRNISQTYRAEDSYNSDESFYAEVKVPRLKKITRSKTVSKPTKSVITDITQGKNTVSCKAKFSSSNESTTSDVNLQVLANKAKSKKFSKMKSIKKVGLDFSDSDEEPLSKLTVKSIEGSQKSVIPIEKQEPIKASRKASSKPPEVEDLPETKPKRECAKIPQNYLPMFSSSDEEDIFHGFDEKIEKTKPLSVMDPSCSHIPPLLDLLNKDLSRRFGKEKVNMSNEQIEKWLKDSALAGSSIKKENDGMLKFGEKITNEVPKTEKPIIKPDAKLASIESTPVKSDSSKVSDVSKPTIDRKLIFRNHKKESAPNINAFSPENESSVYAFGEENEDVISTPFRRPSRRPSSTATSRSEDESSKFEDTLKIGQFRKPSLKHEPLKSTKDESEPNIEPEENTFYIPQKPSKHCLSKFQNKTLLKISRSNERLSESDDFKYKIPSSPSASSSSSTKLYKRQTQKQKSKLPDSISSVYVSDFPRKTDPACLVEAPIFHPTDQEFQDPLEYIERIRHKAEQFGICRIVPPSTFKPECKVTDDMRFTAYNQYVHKMLHRWGPNFKELMAIKKYLETQNISLVHPPWIGGMEIDLPKLYQTVQTLGGLKEVIEKKKWPRVSELMKIPKSAQDRVTKLDDIYCKYLLPYDTLSIAEREKLFDEVETEWAKRESKSLMKIQQKSPNPETADNDSDFEDDADECITKGRNMALNAFYRIARNTMSMYFKTNEPTAQEVEQEYWKYVTMRQNHICVNSGSIDSGNWGYGFAVSKNSPFARHPWNLKVLTNNSGSLLRSLAPLMAVTVPTLHVGMVFSACCWYRDPHGLPWIEYLHTGGNKIWYAIPNSTSDLFRTTLQKIVPNYCKNKELWLPSDTVMVPPSLLVENGVSLCRTVQEPGQFVVVFPKAFTSCLSTGYTVSESVYFAPSYWLKTAGGLFATLRTSCEPSMFSLDRLLINISNDPRCNAEILRQVEPFLREVCDRERERRERLGALGTMVRERLPLPPDVGKSRKRKVLAVEEGDYECDVCRMSLFVSMVFDTVEGINYCLDHGIEMLELKSSQLPNCKFMFTYDDDELFALSNKIKTTIENKGQKKVPSKYAGMPTLLTK